MEKRFTRARRGIKLLAPKLREWDVPTPPQATIIPFGNLRRLIAEEKQKRARLRSEMRRE